MRDSNALSVHVLSIAFISIIRKQSKDTAAHEFFMTNSTLLVFHPMRGEYRG